MRNADSLARSACPPDELYVLPTVFLPPARRAKGGIAITQGPKIRFFAPQGRLVAPILAKLGFGPLLHDS